MILMSRMTLSFKYPFRNHQVPASPPWNPLSLSHLFFDHHIIFHHIPNFSKPSIRFLLSNFNFIHPPQILHCLKAIDKYRNVHAHLCVLCSHAWSYCSRRAKIVVSIHWTLLSSFYFLHHPQIMLCLKAITKYRNVHAHLCVLCSHAWRYCSRRAKIVVSIHWTLLSSFHFLHHPQIMLCLKAITKYRNVYAHCVRIHAHITPKFV